MANETTPLLYMDAVIQPNRSLTVRGMWIVLGVFAAFNLWVAVSREGVKGPAATVWASPTAFTRVRFEGGEQARRLSLHLSSR